MSNMHWTVGKGAPIMRGDRFANSIAGDNIMVLQLTRRSALALAGAVPLLHALPATAQADAWPTRPVRLLVPFPPGGGADLIGRLFGQRLSALWGQPVVIENRPGASTMIAEEMVARAAPDGYTLVLSVSNHSSNPAMFAKVPFDTIKDFTPITMISSAPAVLVVNPSLPVKTTRELIALMKDKPGKLSYGSAGNGSIGHLAGELFKQMARVDMVHVSYKGTGPAELDLIGGTIDVMFTGLVTGAPQVKAGRMRGIAIAGRTRSEILPDLPTVQEEVPGFESGIWYGLLGPAGLPPAISARIHRDTTKTLQEPDVRQRLLAQGAESIGSTPEQFRAYIVDEVARFQQLVRNAGIKSE